MSRTRSPSPKPPSSVPDVLAHALRAVFCGINPGRVSAAAGDGLLAEASLLPGEDAALFRLLAEEIRAQFEPVGELEQLLVDRITSCAWRLRRVVLVEAGLFVAQLNYALANKPGSDRDVAGLGSRLAAGESPGKLGSFRTDRGLRHPTAGSFRASPEKGSAP